MKKSKFTKTQIVKAIKRQEAGTAVEEICRELGITAPTFYKWKATYGGMEVAEITFVKEFETELAHYKRMYAKHGSNHQALKDMAAKKW